jgi:hypothetical protein
MRDICEPAWQDASPGRALGHVKLGLRRRLLENRTSTGALRCVTLFGLTSTIPPPRKSGHLPSDARALTFGSYRQR